MTAAAGEGGGDPRAQPIRAFVTVDEVAAMAVYLASVPAASEQITGTMLSVDGGWMAG